VLNKNDQVEIEINDLSINGQGIGKVDGAVVFCKNLLPGDIAKVKIIKKTKRFYIAIPIEVLKKSKQYGDVKCAHFSKCGGCTIQHMAYQHQLAYKTHRVISAFKRIGDLDTHVVSCARSPQKYNYRNKAIFPVKKADGKVLSGFYRPNSHDIIDINDCPIQQQKINTVFAIIKDWLSDSQLSIYDETTRSGLVRNIYVRISKTGEIMAGLICVGESVPNLDTLIDRLRQIEGFSNFSININSGVGNALLSDITVTKYGNDHILHEILGLKFNVSMQSFLQVNTDQCESLYQKALDYADIKPNDIVVDLFCGIGTLSLLAAQKAKQVYGIEYVACATDNARINAKNNGIKNTRFISGDCTKEYKKLYKKIESVDTVIVDPPRKGLQSDLIDLIIKSAPNKIVYVSCDPSTLARDLKLFSKAYDIVEATPYDMFPQTTHVETVTMIQRKDTPKS
jgi:23S rRNA (uracil1939-C5)-methyltransferase